MMNGGDVFIYFSVLSLFFLIVFSSPIYAHLKGRPDLALVIFHNTWIKLQVYASFGFLLLGLSDLPMDWRLLSRLITILVSKYDALSLYFHGVTVDWDFGVFGFGFWVFDIFNYIDPFAKSYILFSSMAPSISLRILMVLISTIYWVWLRFLYTLLRFEDGYCIENLLSFWCRIGKILGWPGHIRIVEIMDGSG